MSALFPTFLSLGKRIKSLLATDIKSIWQSLEVSEQTNDFQLTAYPHW
jgi:hypothetical protein